MVDVLATTEPLAQNTSVPSLLESTAIKMGGLLVPLKWSSNMCDKVAGV